MFIKFYKKTSKKKLKLTPTKIFNSIKKTKQNKTQNKKKTFIKTIKTFIKTVKTRTSSKKINKSNINTI